MQQIRFGVRRSDEHRKGKGDMIIELCEKECFCKDCTDERCIFAGDKMADCPKWVCDENGDCDNCTFLKGFYADMEKGGVK